MCSGDKRFPVRKSSVIRFSKVWCWVVITTVVMFGADGTTLLAQTNDVSISQETHSSDSTDEIVTPSKVESQQGTSTSRSPSVDIDPTAL